MREDPALDATVQSGREGSGGDPTLPASGEPASAPTRIGRYTVTRRLGVGGMGVVWAATDPELDRTVAIKEMLERVGGDEVAVRERARREAQALARLTHPNVVAVYDVVVERGRIYIVMQHVDGEGLDRWLEAARRTPAEILARFDQAGRGLAAAHAAGLIHRDFKPANVLVSRDGPAQVTDFGLALTSSTVVSPDAPRGEIVGTPAYMAPEQLDGGGITPAADQFGFCVALWEALCHERPFVGRSLAELGEATARGAIAPPPSGALPRRIERALRRGLSPRPADRFPSVEALLAAIRPPRRLAWWLAGGGAVIVAAIVALVVARPHAAATPCAGVDAPIDALWTDARRTHLRDHLPGGQRRLGSTDDLLRVLDGRAARWRATRIDACEATEVRHTQPAEAMASRTACLDASLDDLGAALDALDGIDDEARAMLAVAIARSGVDPAECALDGRARRPRVAPLELARRVAAMRVASQAGHERDVMRDGPALAREVEATGDLELLADVWWAIAQSSGWSPTETIREAHRRAAETATAVGRHGDATMELSKAAETAAQLGDTDAAKDLLAMARGEAKLTGTDTATLRVELATASIAVEAHQLDTAIAEARRIADATTDVDRAGLHEVALEVLDDALIRAERWAEDVEVAAEVEQSMIANWGPDHPARALPRAHLAMARFELGHRDEARALWRESNDIIARAYGASSVQLMNQWSDIAITESEGGNVASPEARDASDRALAIGKAALPPDDPQLARLWWIDATLRDGAGDADGARASYDGALAVYEQLDDVEAWARLAVTAAALDQRTGQCTHAAAHVARVIALGDQGKVTPVVTSVARANAGLCLIARDATAGLAAAQRAIDELVAQGEVEQAADVELSVAEAQVARDQVAAAKTLARGARARVPDDDGTSTQLRARADAILAR